MRKRRRITPEFKSKVVLDVLTGVQSPAEACPKHAPSPNLLAPWKTTFLERAHTLFQPDEQRDEDQARIAELEQLLGRSTRQIEILEKTSTLMDATSARNGIRSNGNNSLVACHYCMIPVRSFISLGVTQPTCSLEDRICEPAPWTTSHAFAA